MPGDFNPFKAPVPTRRAASIIAAARAIIAEKGGEAVKRREVAERAGITGPEVSRVFRNRAELMHAVDASQETQAV